MGPVGADDAAVGVGVGGQEVEERLGHGQILESQMHLFLSIYIASKRSSFLGGTFGCVRVGEGRGEGKKTHSFFDDIVAHAAFPFWTQSRQFGKGLWGYEKAKAEPVYVKSTNQKLLMADNHITAKKKKLTSKSKH